MDQPAPQSPMPAPDTSGVVPVPAAPPPYAPQIQYQTPATPPVAAPLPPVPPPVSPAVSSGKRFPWLLVSVILIVLVATAGGGFAYWRYSRVQQDIVPIEIEDQVVENSIRVKKLVLPEPGFLVVKWFDFNNGVLIVASTIYLEPDTYIDFSIKLNDSAKEYAPLPAGARMLALGVKDVNGNRNLDQDEDFPIRLSNGKSMQVEFRLK